MVISHNYGRFILLVHRCWLMRSEVHANLQGNSCAVKYENNYKPISQKHVRNKFTFYEQLTIRTLVNSPSSNSPTTIPAGSLRIHSGWYLHIFNTHLYINKKILFLFLNFCTTANLYYRFFLSCYVVTNNNWAAINVIYDLWK